MGEAGSFCRSHRSSIPAPMRAVPAGFAIERRALMYLVRSYRGVPPVRMPVPIGAAGALDPRQTCVGPDGGHPPGFGPAPATGRVSNARLRPAGCAHARRPPQCRVHTEPIVDPRKQAADAMVVMRFIARAGGPDCIFALQAAAICRYPGSNPHGLRAEATRCLAQLEAHVGAQAAHQNLVRQAERPNEATLLRPAGFTTTHEDRLVRASAPADCGFSEQVRETAQDVSMDHTIQAGDQRTGVP